jgi:hypothetical protein
MSESSEIFERRGRGLTGTKFENTLPRSETELQKNKNRFITKLFKRAKPV